MVRDGYHFDEELLKQASTFISSIIKNINRLFEVDDFLKFIGQDSPNPAAVYVDSMTVLLSSPHPSIAWRSLSFIRTCQVYGSAPTRLTLVSSKLFPRIISIPHFRDLSVIGDQGILSDILTIFQIVVKLSSPNNLRSIPSKSEITPQFVRDVMLNEVLIPIEPSLVQISRNRQLSSWEEEFRETLQLLVTIFYVSVFHQPALDFICSSRIPMAFQSLLSTVEHVYTYLDILDKMINYIHSWQEDGAETWHRGRILLQTLEREGFRDRIEQTLIGKSSVYGRSMRYYSYGFMINLGVNSLRS